MVSLKSCPTCTKELHAEARICGCGHQFNETRTKSEKTALILGAVGLAIILTMIGFSMLPDQSNGAKLVPASTRPAEGQQHNWTAKPVAVSVGSSARTKLTCLCATSIDWVGPVLQAFRDGDMEAMTGLVVRGKAITLKEGTKVHVLSDYNGASAVLVESGRHIGEHCWTWGTFIE